MSVDTLKELVNMAVEQKASDIHLMAYSPPVLRVDGRLINVGTSALTLEHIHQVFEGITSKEHRAIFQQEQELDFAYRFPGSVRLRVNACNQNGTLSLVFRLIRTSIPSVAELGLPPLCETLARKSHGLVVVSGSAGCGKSTTLAAMVEYLNHAYSRRIVTVEDPIEYEYRNDQCVITQRDVGLDTHSFNAALTHVLRQDPDVVMVGEMRDAETAAAVIATAETGHLVLCTAHAPTAHLCIQRIIDLFPAGQQALEQARLASVLLAVLSQMLVPRADGPGRVPAVEIMTTPLPIKELIRDGKIHQLPGVIKLGAQEGMRSMDAALAALYARRLITKDEAFGRCDDVREMTRMVGELPGDTSVFRRLLAARRWAN